MVIDQKWFCKDGRIKANAPLDIRAQYFIDRAKEIHGNRYDYSLTKYIRSTDKVEIICKEHGVFKQIASDHLGGHNCPLCGKNSRNIAITHTLDEFIIKAKAVHGDTYSYTLIQTYINSKTEVPILCSIHGIFNQKPNNHLMGEGCSKCADIRLSDTKESFIKKAISVHGTKYTYNNVKYVNTRTPVSITCSKHGDFMQKPCSHLNGKSGCPICAKESYMSNLTTRGLYLLYSPTLGVYKIGITNNISKRLLKLNSKGEHFSLVKFYNLNNNEHSMKLEKYLHQYFKDKQCTDFLDTDLDGKTELFYLDENDINYIDSYIKSYCKNIGIDIE